MNRSLGQMIRKRRHELKMTLKDVSQILECSMVYISDVERGNRSITNENLIKLIDYLKLNKTEILKLAAEEEKEYIKININDPIIETVFTLLKYKNILTKDNYNEIIKYIKGCNNE